MRESPVKIDILLDPLLDTTNDEQADAILSKLITDHAEPVIKGVIRFRLRLNSARESQRAEADDLHQEAVLQLVAQLQRLRQLPGGNPITNLRGIAAVIAHRTCARWLRRQFPERHALKNRLHYVLTRQRGFAVWQDENGKLVAGFAAWKQQKATTSITRLSEVETLPDQIRALKRIRVAPL
jgi:DNA-directed RNA polymerase specialized sigma24 family protein